MITYNTFHSPNTTEQLILTINQTKISTCINTLKQTKTKNIIPKNNTQKSTKPQYNPKIKPKPEIS